MSDLTVKSKASMVRTVSTQVPSDRESMLRVVRFGIFCLPLLAFTIPGRDVPVSFGSIDALAVGKVLALLVVVSFGSLLLVQQFHGGRSRGCQPSPEARTVLWAFVPYLMFLGWAALSVLWTANVSVSLGQAGGLASLLIIALLVGLLAGTKAGIERVLKSLAWSLLMFSSIVLMVHFLAPGLSGLDRRMLITGADGLVHPTAAAANSSLGLLVVLMCWLVQRYSWAGRLALVAVCVHGTALFLTSSRTALGASLVTIVVMFFISGDNRRRAWIGMASALLALVMLVTDPGFRVFSDPESVGVTYVTRGQSFTQLKALSGREEMWSKVWDEYLKSPLKGHGYFLTSSTGEMEVWEMKANHTAHNIYLQVVSGTGLIGLGLFLIAVGTLLLRFLKLRQGDAASRKMFQMLFLVMLWFFGWTLLSASFMGPVRSESVCFYTFLGLGVGGCVRMASSGTSLGRRREIADA